MKPYRVAAVTLALALMVGCQGKPDPGVTPYTSISPSATPTTPVPTPTPVKAKLDAEAKERYLAYQTEMFRLEEAGGTDSLGPIMESFVDEPYRSTLAQYLKEQKDAGVRVEGTRKVAAPTVSPIDESAVPGAIVALRACVDGTPAVAKTADGREAPGSIIVSDFWFKRDDAGVLRIFHGAAKKSASC